MGLYSRTLVLCSTRGNRSGSKETEENGKENEKSRNDVAYERLYSLNNQLKYF